MLQTNVMVEIQFYLEAGAGAGEKNIRSRSKTDRLLNTDHRGIEEGKERREGKGCRFCLGTKLIQFLAALDIFHQADFEEKDE